MGTANRDCRVPVGSESAALELGCHMVAASAEASSFARAVKPPCTHALLVTGSANCSVVAALAVARSQVSAVEGALHGSSACYNTPSCCRSPSSMAGVSCKQFEPERSLLACTPCFASPANKQGTIKGQRRAKEVWGTTVLEMTLAYFV